MTKAAIWSHPTSLMVSSTMSILAMVSLEDISAFDRRIETVPNSHPHERSDITNLGSLGSQRRISHRSSSNRDFGRVELVGVNTAAREGIAGKSDGSGTCCVSGTSSDGAGLNWRGSGEHAGDGRGQDGGEDTLHVVDGSERSCCEGVDVEFPGERSASYIDFGARPKSMAILWRHAECRYFSSGKRPVDNGVDAPLEMCRLAPQR
jgi:hypothetical protein